MLVEFKVFLEEERLKTVFSKASNNYKKIIRDNLDPHEYISKSIKMESEEDKAFWGELQDRWLLYLKENQILTTVSSKVLNGWIL